MTTGSAYLNPSGRPAPISTTPASVLDFHRELPGYQRTRLVEMPSLAAELGVRRLFAKEECARMGLPSFKILGASYAASRALSAALGSPDVALSITELQRRLGPAPDIRLVTATDGNHGRAVARMAALLGIGADIYLPDSLSAAVQTVIAGEGARIHPLPMDYDAVVEHAALAAFTHGQQAILLQDTAWDGYTQIPQWIVDGYSTVFVETAAQLLTAGENTVDVAFVPVGVGSFAQAAVSFYQNQSPPTAVVGVEAHAAPCLQASLRAGQPTTVPTHHTAMAGLNCGTLSSIAWPILRAGLGAAVTVTDAEASAAESELRVQSVDAGPCGAATLAGARATLHSAFADQIADRTSVMVLFSTEGRNANPG